MAAVVMAAMGDTVAVGAMDTVSMVVTTHHKKRRATNWVHGVRFIVTSLLDMHVNFRAHDPKNKE